MPERLISERLVPVAGENVSCGIVTGNPALPAKFRWRKEEIIVAAVLDEWKECGDCRHGSGERYVGKHWFRLRAQDGTEMKIYFERQARSARQQKSRWWIYSLGSK